MNKSIQLTQPSRLFIRDGISLKRNIWTQNIVFLLLLVLGLMIRQGQGFLLFFTVLGATVLTEFFTSWVLKKKHQLAGGWSLLWGIMFLFLIPLETPWYVGATVVFGTLSLFRLVLGGYGESWLNPVGLMALFLILSNSQSPDLIQNDSWGRGKEGVHQRIAEGAENQKKLIDFAIQEEPSSNVLGLSDFVNNWFFAPLGLKVPTGYFSLAFSSRFSTFGQLLGLWIMLFSIYLLAQNMINRRVVLSFGATYLILVYIFGDLPFSGQLFNTDVFFHLFAGQFALMSFFVLPLIGFIPHHNKGQLLYGVFAALFSLIFRLLVRGPDTMVLGIMAANLLLPVINHFFRKKNEKLENRFAS